MLSRPRSASPKPPAAPGRESMPPRRDTTTPAPTPAGSAGAGAALAGASGSVGAIQGDLLRFRRVRSRVRPGDVKVQLALVPGAGGDEQVPGAPPGIPGED